MPHEATKRNVHDERLTIMRQQEDAVYYRTSSSVPSTPLVVSPVIHQAVEALQQIFTLCQLQNYETLVVATSYLDRYLQVATHGEEVGLVALMCFYIAVKVHESAAISMSCLPHLYQRFFSSHQDKDEGYMITLADLEQLELEVCQALNWRLNPPTAFSFVRELLGRVASSSETARNTYPEVQAPLERAFRADPHAFVHHYKASHLAQAALQLSTFDLQDCVAVSEDELLAARAFLRRSPKRDAIKKRPCPSRPCSPTTVAQEEEQDDEVPRPRKQRKMSMEGTTSTSGCCHPFQATSSPRSTFMTTLVEA